MSPTRPDNMTSHCALIYRYRTLYFWYLTTACWFVLTISIIMDRHNYQRSKIWRHKSTKWLAEEIWRVNAQFPNTTVLSIKSIFQTFSNFCRQLCVYLTLTTKYLVQLESGVLSPFGSNFILIQFISWWNVKDRNKTFDRTVPSYYKYYLNYWVGRRVLKKDSHLFNIHLK